MIVVLGAFALTWLLDDQPLRKTVESAGTGESFAMPRDQTSLEEIEQALTSLVSRENRYWVYNRDGRPCRTCQTIIRARGQGDDNRTTFWCPTCQK